MTPSLVGTTVEVEVGPVAHGGHCVARIGGDHGRVVFVRHALPGEKVLLKITEDTGAAFCRGDAVEILRPSPDRVTPPCPYAGPGRCGGCDWQHARPQAQRELKAAVVAEQLRRLAQVEPTVRVSAVPGGSLGWRTRISYAVDPSGRTGLRRHRSHHVQPVERCLLGADGVGDAPELSRNWRGAVGLDIAVDDRGRRSVSVARAAPGNPGGRVAGGRRGRPPTPVTTRVSGPETLRHRVGDRDYRVAADGFWQVHPEAAHTLSHAVLDAAGPLDGATVFDLYAGAGLFTAALAEAVGATGRVVGVEGSNRAARDAANNVARWPWAEIRTSAVTAEAVHGLGPADVVVLDPPRTGAGRDILTAVLGAARSGVVYVACDPASLARDVRTALDLGWELGGLRAFDLFPMTHHVECVALLVPQAPPVSAPVSWATP